MAWINIASTRFELRQKLLKSLEGWESGIDLIGDHRLGLYALMCGDEKLYERTNKFTSQWLAYYSAKDDETLTQNYVFPIFTGLSVLEYIQKNHTSDCLSRVADLQLPPQHPYQALQELVKEYIGDAVRPERALKKGLIRIKTGKGWAKLVSGLDIHTLFDLAICPDHPSWLMTLSDYCLPLALLLYKAKNLKKSSLISRYLQLGATPSCHSDVLFERQTGKLLIEAEVNSSKGTWPGFDAVEIVGEELFVYYWLGFEWRAELDFNPEEKLNAFRPLQFIDYNWELVNEAVDSNSWSIIQQCRHDKKITYVLLYDKASTKENIKQTEKASMYLNQKLRLADFLMA